MFSEKLYKGELYYVREHMIESWSTDINIASNWSCLFVFQAYATQNIFLYFDTQWPNVYPKPGMVRSCSQKALFIFPSPFFCDCMFLNWSSLNCACSLNPLSVIRLRQCCHFYLWQNTITVSEDREVKIVIIALSFALYGCVETYLNVESS